MSLLAGSYRYLAYALGYEFGEHERVSTTSEYLWIRTRSGERRDLGPAPKRLNSTSMSIIDGTLYGVTGNDPNHPTPEVVHWWNLRTHAMGRAKLPSRLTFLTGAPHGFVVQLHKNQLVKQSLSGKRTPLGTPFPHADFVNAVAGPKGFVVYAYDSDGKKPLMAYGQWSSPGHYRELAPNTTQSLQCTSVSRFAVGCEGAGDSDQSPPPIFALVPLTGAPATASGGGAPGETPHSTLDTGINTALAGRIMLWQANPALVSISAAHPKPRRGPRSLARTQYAFETRGYDPYSSLHLPWAVVSAFGGVAMLNDQHTSVVLARSATDTHRLFRVPATDH